MDKPWTDLLTTFGLATTILVAVGVGAWRVLAWTGREIVIPARDHLLARMAGFFDRLDETIAKMDDGVNAMRDNLESQTQALHDLKQATERTGEAVSTLDRTVQDKLKTALLLQQSVEELRREVASSRSQRAAAGLAAKAEGREDG